MDLPKLHVCDVDGERYDSYTASIELSNACRQFYVKRVRAAESVRKKLVTTDHNKPQATRTNMDDMMDKLKSEVASLLDLDLALMKQLLTLNDSIEDLKWQRRLVGKPPIESSSCDLDSSSYTLTDGEEYPEKLDFASKYPSPSSLSLFRDHRSYTGDINTDIDDFSSTWRSVKSSRDTLKSSNKVINYKAARSQDKVRKDSSSSGLGHHEEQQSFDSGIHEPDRAEIIV